MMRFLTTACFLILGGLLPAQSGPVNLLSNPSFEQGQPANFLLPAAWVVDPGLQTKGLAIRSTHWMESGKWSLRLSPNANNGASAKSSELAVNQKLPPSPFRGKSLYFSGWIRAIQGATAILRVVVVGPDGQPIQREVTKSSAAEDAPLAFFRDIIDIPDQDNLVIAINCAVGGTDGSAYFDDITLAPADTVSWKVGQYDPGPPLSAAIGVDATKIVRSIPPAMYGINFEWPYAGQGLWDPREKKPDPQVFQLARDLGLTGTWRWPGGLFSDYYDWRNGVGPVESRPNSLIVASGDLSPNTFGTDEALSVAESLNGSLMITTNAHTGTADQAAEWVRYVNNGYTRAKYWEVGNELYLNLPSQLAASPPWTPERYVQVYPQFASAMRAADPNIKIGVDLEFNFPSLGCLQVGATGCWAALVLKNLGDQMDFVSVHNGFAPAPLGPDGGWDVRTVYAALLAAPVQEKKTMRLLAEKIDALAGPNAKNIKIAVTEWGPYYAFDGNNRFIDHAKTLASGVYAASTMKMLLEEPRVELANAFKLVDSSELGWIGARNDQHIAKAPYYALQMYTKYFGPLLVNSSVSSPGYDTRSIGWIPAMRNVPYLEAVSSISQDGGSLYLIVINKNMDRAIDASIVLNGFRGTGGGLAHTLTGLAPDANTGTTVPLGYAQQAVVQPNGRFYLGGPGEISVTDTGLSQSGSCFVYEFPPLSVTALILPGYRYVPGADEDACADGSVGPGPDQRTAVSPVKIKQ